MANLQFAASIDMNDAASEEECEDQERESRSSRSKIDSSKCFFCKESDRIDNRLDLHSLPDHQEARCGLSKTH